MQQLLIVVAAVLRDAEGLILVQQRPEGKQMAGLWEFPGGKVEPGESPEQALVRELAEELGITIAPSDLQPMAFASEPLGDRHLMLLLYACGTWTGTPLAIEATAIRWASIDELRRLPMPPADGPLVEQLARLMSDPASSPSV